MYVYYNKVAILQKQVYNLSGKVIHAISVQYIFYLQCYSGKISIWKFCPIDIYKLHYIRSYKSRVKRETICGKCP